MKTRWMWQCAAAALAILGPASAAKGAMLVETLQGATFYDGGIATGSFVYDTVSHTISTFSISVSGGDTFGLTPFTYDNTTANASIGTGELGVPLSRVAFDKNDNSRYIAFLLENSLPDGGGTDPFHIWPNGESDHGAGFECTNCGSFRNFSAGALTTGTVPEPATVGVTAIGLAVLGLRLRNRAVRHSS